MACFIGAPGRIGHLPAGGGCALDRHKCVGQINVARVKLKTPLLHNFQSLEHQLRLYLWVVHNGYGHGYELLHHFIHANARACGIHAVMPIIVTAALLAYANAKDSGQTSGWQKILERLELLGPGELTLSERITGQDWDIIGIELSDQQLSELQEVLFKVMIPEYGRTCRRYTPVSRATESIHLLVGTFDDAHTTLEATLPQCALAITSSSDIFDNEYSTVEAAIWQ